MRTPFALATATATVAAVGALAAVGAAQAGPVTTATPATTRVVVPDGAYSSYPTDPRIDVMDYNVLGFKVRNRKVYDVRTSVVMTCRNSDTGREDEIAFMAKHLRPAVTVPANGKVRVPWTATDNGRRGTVLLRITFRTGRAALASVDVRATGGLERCDAYWPFRLRRASIPR